MIQVCSPSDKMNHTENIWMFPKIGVPQNGWFILENLIKMDDLGVPLYLETPICHHAFFHKRCGGSKGQNLLHGKVRREESEGLMQFLSTKINGTS